MARRSTYLQSVSSVSQWLPRFFGRCRPKRSLKHRRYRSLSRRFAARSAAIEALEDRRLLATLVLTPSQDNTLIEFPSGNSNGAGELFAGRVGSNSGTTIRRAVMAFDLSKIPVGSTVTEASLDLTVSRAGTGSGPESMSLHKLTADWGEGSSSGGGQGAPATSGDATWVHRFFDTSTWTNPGGNFVSTVSATTTVSGGGDTPRWSAAGMVTNVQAWVDTPATNFGWILLGNESTPRTVKRFNSKDSGSNPPQLTVTYTEAAATLSLTIAAASISEGAGAGATTGTVSRTGDSSNSLVVSLSSDDTSEARVPASVTIAAGQSTSPPFNIDAVDDAVLDGTQTVILTASANGLATGTDSLDVTDDDLAALTLTIAANSISEGAGPAATTATVTRNTATTSSLVVNLASDDTSEATVPASVTIAAGQTTSPPFNIAAVDDAALDGTQTVILTASANGLVAGKDSVDVTDDDVAALTLMIAANSISEGAGTAATTATVSRNTATTNALVVSLASDDTSEATVPASVTIAAGQTTSPAFNIDAVDDALVDGTQIVTITAKAAGLADSLDSLDVTDDDLAALTLTIVAGSISEGAGAAATTATVTRNSDATNALVINLASNDTSEATVPATVTIAAGQVTSPAFNIDAVDDALADGTQTVTVTATASGFTDGTGSVDVTDDDVATLTLTIPAAAISESAGTAATTATVSRNSDTTNALVIDLVSDDTSEATVPATVTIEAGQTTSPPFNIAAVDDSILDGEQTVTVTASASGFLDGTDSVNVTDDELANLTLTISAQSISEGAGTAATTATVTRPGDTTNALVISLASNDTSEATVPASVTIAAGQTTSPAFDIGAVDDALVDGTQTVIITASAAGFSDGTDSLEVTDDDLATLTLVIAAASVSEAAGAGATTATITRNTDTSSALVVDLASNDTSEATVPSSVTIPLGSTSTTFDVAAVDDLIDDETQQVTITASVAGFVDGAGTLDVTDDDITVTIRPDRDNTLYENQSGALSNGAGDFLFSGSNGSGSVRRAAVDFDLAAAGIPSSASIGMVELEMTVSRNSSAANENISIHKLAGDWGEGTSNAPGGEGGGTAATTGDATWLHTFFDTLLWTDPGGDFEALASATASVAGANSVAAWTSAEMVADVAAWLVAPATNFGWVLVGNESASSTAKQFESKENLTGSPPLLTVTYSVPLQHLSVSIDATEVSENGGTTSATVTRTQTAGDLTVNLSSSDAGEATIIASVTIPDGQATSDPVAITAVNDTLLDGTQTVTFTATADGHEPGIDVLDVTDDETTWVQLDAGNLVIADAGAGQTDDQLTLALEGSDLIVRDPQNSITTDIPAASGQGTNELRVPLSAFSGQLSIDARGGSDSLTLDGSIDNTLANRMSFMGGPGEDSLVLLGEGITLNLSQFTDVDRIDITGSGNNALNVDLASALNNVDNAADPLTLVSDLGDALLLDDGWSIPETFVDAGAFFRVVRQAAAKLHVGGPFDWQNPAQSLDVSGDGVVVSRDALLIINELNQPTYTTGTGRLVDAASLDPFPLFFFDVLASGFATPSGAARIINFLNSQISGEAEGEMNRDLAANQLSTSNESRSTVRDRQRLAVRDGLFATSNQEVREASNGASLHAGARTVPAAGQHDQHQLAAWQTDGNRASEAGTFRMTAARRPLTIAALSDLPARLDSSLEEVLHDLTGQATAGFDVRAVDHHLQAFK